MGSIGFLILALSVHVGGANFFGSALDYATPVLSTADAGSDAYVCYHFWQTAKAEHERPVFFSVSACLILLSSLCGVGLFIFQNWGRSEDEQDDNPQSYVLLMGLEENEDEDEESAVSFGSGWCPRLDIQKRLRTATSCLEDIPVVPCLMKCVILLLFVLLLLPLGQLLPILLWLQAKQENRKVPKLPTKPIFELEKPVFPKDLQALNGGKEPTASEIYGIFRIANTNQREALKLYYIELREWQSELTVWYAQEYLPYLDQLDRYFQWELKMKIATNLPFVIETGVEAIPQSLLQTTAIVIESQRNPAAISWVQFVSVGVSMVSIASKAYILCSSMVRTIFNFKMICLSYDLAALFYTFASFWSLRRGDENAVTVFFLTRPVDIYTAVYVWMVFSWLCVLVAWMVARGACLVCNWLLMQYSFSPVADKKDKDLFEGAMGIFIDSVAESWPCRLSLISTDENGNRSFDPACPTSLNIHIFMFAAFTTILVALACGLIVITTPVLLILLGLRSFWICLWIFRMESAMTEHSMMGPNLVNLDDVHKVESAKFAGDLLFDGQHEWWKDIENFQLHMSSDVESLASAHSRVLIPPASSSEFLSVNKVFVAGCLPGYIAEFNVADDAEVVQERNLRKSGFYGQAYAWASEGADFSARLRAVKHGLLTQHSSEVVSGCIGTLPSWLFLRFCAAVMTNIATSIDLIRLPPKILGIENLFDAFRSPWSFHGRLIDQIIAEDDTDASLKAILQSSIASWRGIRPYYLLNTYVISPFGWLIQKLLIGMTCLVAAYGFLLPLFSFALACHSAIRNNQCRDTTISAESSLLSQLLSKPIILQHSIRDLFDDDCYDHGGSALNAFRVILFLIQAFLLLGVILHGLIGARKFIIFALIMPKYDIEEDPDDLMKEIQQYYQKFYASDQEGKQSSEMEEELAEEQTKEQEEGEPEQEKEQEETLSKTEDED